MPRPALFLDRDGTVIAEKNYLADPAGVELIPGVREFLREAQRRGWLLFLHSNQSGIGRGLFTADDAWACTQRMFDLLGLPEAFAGVCLAPEAPDEPFIYRKPSPRFVREMQAAYGFAPRSSWFIGDRPVDAQTGMAAALRSALVESGHELSLVERAWCQKHGIPVLPSLPAAAELLFAHD